MKLNRLPRFPLNRPIIALLDCRGLLIVLSALSPNAFSSESIADSVGINGSKPRPVYTATRLCNSPPTIDGVLNDSCWISGNWAGDFTQLTPREGAQPSQPTQFKILYDDRNIYIAIRAYDYEPSKVIRKAGRRDEFSGDMVGIAFDSYHDHRTGFEFDVAVAGNKVDLVLTNPVIVDLQWNAVWQVKTAMEDSAWTAEFEIPLSQLRYSGDKQQVWGLHCWRWIDRLQEESDWEPQTRTGAGALYLFGDLRGIGGLPQSRRIEIMPFALEKLSTFPPELKNPFANNGRAWQGTGGLDAKIGFSSNFTLDLSVNPDFGQVESDPSVMNLTAFETLYDERRPFFLEGRNIFNFDFDDINLFYSRRIGHFASYTPLLQAGESVNMPGNTTILDAVKLSGKSSDGISVGVLQSFTARGEAAIDSAGTRRDVAVEPLTHYALARVQKDFNEGATIVGGILTSTHRFLRDPQLDFLNRDAFTGGCDLLHQWNDKEFYVDAKVVASTIGGTRTALRTLQSSPAHYVQRPDVRDAAFDSSRTRLSGYGGTVQIGKGSKGVWRYSASISWRSPGLDLNDLGYMQTADLVEQVNALSFFAVEPVWLFRTYSLSLSESNKWDFGLEHLSSGVSLNAYFEFLNNWALSTQLSYTSASLDTRILRGGPAMLLPPLCSSSIYARTDPSKQFFFELSAGLSSAAEQQQRTAFVQPGILFMPMNRLKLSVAVNVSSNINHVQYVDTKSSTNGIRYILASIDQHTLGLTLRIDYNITPEISIQYYGSPFASVGTYSDFKVVRDPRATAYAERTRTIAPLLRDSTFDVLENGNSAVAYSFSNPDFSFSQFRSNFVLRWEYRLGSEIFIVWSQDRTQYLQPGSLTTLEAMGRISDRFANNIVFVKMKYWFTI